MRNFRELLFSALCAAAVILACTDQPMPTQNIPDVLFSTGTDVTKEVLGPVVLFNACTGEDVELTGWVTYFSETRNDGAGGFHVSIHSNIYLTGVGLVTGTEYIWKTNNVAETHAQPPFPVTNSYTRTRRVVTKGNVPMQLLTVREHVTVDANGDVTVATDDFEFRCMTCIDPPADMVHWWPGDRSTDDIVGGNDGTLQNGATFAAGKVKQAFSFDGEDDFVNVPHAEQLNFGTNDFTVDFWVKFRSTDGEQIMVEKWIQKGGEPGNRSMGWTYTKLEGNSVRFAFSSTDLEEYDIDFYPEGGIPTTSWIHVAVTRAGDTYTLYWNGDPIASHTLVATYDLDSNSSLKFGHRGNPDDTPSSIDERGFYLNGSIDEVEIFDRALSDSEIWAVYGAGSHGKCKP